MATTAFVNVDDLIAELSAPYWRGTSRAGVMLALWTPSLLLWCAIGRPSQRPFIPRAASPITPLILASEDGSSQAAPQTPQQQPQNRSSLSAVERAKADPRFLTQWIKNTRGAYDIIKLHAKHSTSFNAIHLSATWMALSRHLNTRARAC